MIVSVMSCPHALSPNRRTRGAGPRVYWKGARTCLAAIFALVLPALPGGASAVSGFPTGGSGPSLSGGVCSPPALVSPCATGGLAVALPNFSRARVYAHLSAFRTRFVKDPDGKARAVGSQIESRDWLSSRVGQSIATRGGPVNLGGGVWLTGEIPRENDYEDTGGAFYLDEACTEPDPVIDDQAMFFETAKGLVVLLGCAHAGVINTLKHIQAATGQAHIHAVLGGMHLLAAGERRMTETVTVARFDSAWPSEAR